MREKSRILRQLTAARLLHVFSVDILADGDDVGIGCVDVLTELPQTVPYPGKICLRNNAVSHAVPSCSAIHHII